ncbi:MAG: globin family protein [Gemmatimonadaceae bacterium]
MKCAITQQSRGHFWPQVIAGDRPSDSWRVRGERADDHSVAPPTLSPKHMTPEQVAHIRNSWALMSSATDDLAIQFYDRLFDLDPSLRSLFKSADMQTQSEKLIQMLTVIVRGVDDLPRLLPSVEALGRRHAGYGVKDAHYVTVGAALLRTFKEVLGGSLSVAAEESWAAAFSTLSDVMMKASRKAA